MKKKNIGHYRIVHTIENKYRVEKMYYLFFIFKLWDKKIRWNNDLVCTELLFNTIHEASIWIVTVQEEEIKKKLS